MNDKYEYKKRFFDLEKEERFLNEMSEKGLAFTGIKWGFFADVYCFEPCEKKYVYREDYNIEPAADALTSPYIKFVTETYDCAFVCIANNRIYFRKDAEKGDFPPVYTDLESRIEAEKKQIWKTLSLVILFLCNFIYIISRLIISKNVFAIALVACWIVLILILASRICRHLQKISLLKKLQSKSEGESS